MNSAPIWFGQQQWLRHFNMQPSEVQSKSLDMDVHKRYLYTKLMSVYDITIPKEWPMNWFRFWLFYYGSIAAIYTKEFGWVAMPYSMTSLDLYYQPSSILVANHLFRSEKVGKIGVNAEIIKLMDDYYGLDDIVSKYASMLAQVDKDININLMNANMALVAQVKTKKDGDDLGEAYGQATQGKPLVIVNKDLAKDSEPLHTLLPSPKQNYIGQELLMTRRNIVNQFLTDIGIPNFNQDKKAQQNNAEIEENQYEVTAISSVILHNLKDCFERVNRISGLELTVRLRPEYARKEATVGTDNAGRIL